MLQIMPYSGAINFRKLIHGPRVFHDALEGVLKGEKNFQVINPDGEDYCLHYTENILWAKQFDSYPKADFMEDHPFYPPYYKYDEEDASKMSFDLFSGMKKVWFKEANEYTITVARLLLAHTDMSIVFADDRIKMFIPESDRLSVSDKEPDAGDPTLMRVTNVFYYAPILNDFNQVDQIYCFHHIFLFQWLTDLPVEQIKYAKICMPKFEGIGSILDSYTRLKKFFDRFGVRTTIEPHSSRYPDDMLQRYFDIPLTPKDSDDTNTVYIVNFFGTWTARVVGKATEAVYDTDSLNPAFRKEMEEYADAVLGNKRMLGVLLRGSDYFTANMQGLSKPVGVELSIPVIRQWMEEDGYDGIFLATEDEDMLSAMKEAFGNTMIAVSQERYSVHRMENVKTIAELEKETYDRDEYDEHLVDVTVNYFYAVYLLSRCESFIYSNSCGGERLTRVFNRGRFKKELCINQTIIGG
ncbi:MAG: hypothetical protein IK152_09340 [Lachnospiraceae bacterium]|nr:hypothetical protein [Lachnospiraceae bacterium]